MADLSVTAANVKLISGQSASGIAGAAITAGQILYREAASNKVKLSDNDNASAEVRAIMGVSLNGAAADQPVNWAINGAVVDFGAAVFTIGTDYYVSGTPGAIAPRADVTTGDDPIRIGTAITTSRLKLDFGDQGVTL